MAVGTNRRDGGEGMDREGLRRAFEAELRTLGCDPRRVDAWVENRADGFVLRRPIIGLEKGRSDHRSQHRHVMHIVSMQSALRRSAIRGFAARAAALLAREDAIANYRAGPLPPAWALVADLATMRLAQTAGWSIDQMTENGNPYSKGVSCLNRGELLCDNGGYLVGRIGRSAVPLEPGRSIGVAAPQFRISGERFLMTSCEIGPDGNTIRIHEGPTLEVLGPLSGTLPLTMISALAGRPLSKVLSHPVLDRLGAQVRSARIVPTGPNKDRLAFTLTRRPVRMAEPPAGVNTDWLDVLAPGWQTGDRVDEGVNREKTRDEAR